MPKIEDKKDEIIKEENSTKTEEKNTNENKQIINEDDDFDFVEEENNAF
jgi:hypothetical protein